MKQKYFAISTTELKILLQESVRKIFHQISIGLFLAVLFPELVVMFANLTSKKNFFQNFIYLPQSNNFGGVILFLFVWLLGIILPGIALILSRRYPPAPVVTFHNDTQKVSWKSGANQLKIPFDSIHFATSRLLSKSGISTVMVTIFSIADRPFFEGEQPSQDSDMKYRKNLCVYKAGTQNEADESIEIIQSFMAGTFDESPSKFDDL